MTLNEKIVEESKRWLGVPYQHRSKSKFGCDCTGLIIGVMQALGYMKSYKMRLYPKDWNMHGMADNHIEEEISRVADKITGPAMAGDIVLFQYEEQEYPAHIGIVLENQMFIHCWKKSGHVQISSFRPWAKKSKAVYRFNEQKLRCYE